jgi:hypothetical protein
MFVIAAYVPGCKVGYYSTLYYSGLSLYTESAETFHSRESSQLRLDLLLNKRLKFGMSYLDWLDYAVIEEVLTPKKEKHMPVKTMIEEITEQDILKQLEFIKTNPKKSADAVMQIPAFGSVIIDLERELEEKGYGSPMKICSHWHAGIKLASAFILALQEKGLRFSQPRMPRLMDSLNSPTVKEAIFDLGNRIETDDPKLLEMINEAHNNCPYVTHKQSFVVGALYVWEVLRLAAESKQQRNGVD